MADNNDDLLSEARDRYQRAMDLDADNISQAREDQAFLVGENHWDSEASAARVGRPKFTINQMPQFLRQITGDMRQMRPSIKVMAVDDNADRDTAEKMAGMVRYIENRSYASAIYGRAIDDQVTCGVGAFRIAIEYADGATFNRELAIAMIDDPVMVLFDPDAQKPTGEDSQWVFVPVDMTQAEFKRRYPDASAEGYGVTGKMDSSIVIQSGLADKIRVCEYWYREPYRRTLYLRPDGSIQDLTDEDADVIAAAQAECAMAKAAGQECEIESRPSFRVMRAVITDNQVLEEPKPHPGRFIPIVRVLGNVSYIGQRCVRWGAIRFARDSQRIYNYAVSAEIEAAALQPKAPFIGTEKNFEDYQEFWSQANIKNFSYLPYKPDPANGNAPPQRVQPPVASQAFDVLVNRAAANIKASIGIYEAGLGQRSNETSGRAIIARQREGDTGAYVYVDNFRQALKHAGQIIIDLIPYIYDTARTVRILGDDGAVESLRINAPYQDASGRVVTHDVTKGAYDVVVDMGPSYATRRDEARDGMTALIQGSPDLAPVIGDLIAKAQEWPGADEIAERLQAVAPPAIQSLIARKNGEPPQPNPADMQAQMQAQAEAGKMQLEREKLQLEAAKLQMEAQKIEVDRLKVQADVVKAQMAQQPQADIGAVAQRLMNLEQITAELIQTLRGASAPPQDFAAQPVA